MSTGGQQARVWAFQLFVAAVAVALVTSTVEAQRDAAASGPRFSDVIAKAPDRARAMHNPMEGQPDATAAGGKLFDQHCSECHGKKAGGTRRGPSLLAREVQQAPPGAIYWVLTNGVVRHGMPVWSKLPEPRRWQIVTFLQSLRPPGG